MDRRSVLLAGAGLASMFAAGGTAIAAESKHGHSHPGGNEAMAKTALECVRTAEVCLRHCLNEFAKGDTTLAVCAVKVEELGIYCLALADGASFNSAYLKELSVLVRKVCEDCEKECRKYEKHKECIDTADACKACSAECKKMTA